METTLSLDDIIENNLESFKDSRGEIFTTYKDEFRGLHFNHDKICFRHKDVLVGIHGDFETHKLITCLYGEVFIALVDNRPQSKDYLKYKTFIINGQDKKQLFIPPGIGNSFLVLSDTCVYNYKLAYDGEYNDVDKQFTLKWNDSKYNIPWPIKNPILSDRDK